MKTCKEVHKLLHSDKKLSLMQKIELKIHMAICKHCDSYRRHLNLVRQGVAKWVTKASDVDMDRVKKLEKKVLERNKKQ